jgi:hypothetical protein
MLEAGGTHFRSSLFKVREVVGSASESQLLGLIGSTIPVVHMRNAITNRNCAHLIKHFKESKGTHPRSDGVSGDVLGAYHYGKTYDQYTKEIDASENYVREFLLSGENPVATVISMLRNALRSRGIVIRPAMWHNHTAAVARAVSWTARGHFLLEPHEDMGQLSDPRQYGFEAQKAFGRTVIAVNLYPNVPAGGGLLRIWNLVPNDEMRTKFGTRHTGFPYPIEAVSGVQSIELSPSTGSVVLMNGGLMHAVTGYKEMLTQDNPRLIINFFVGSIDPGTTVYWV